MIYTNKPSLSTIGSMTTSLSLICGRCDHSYIVASACFVILISLIGRSIGCFLLGFGNAKSKCNNRHQCVTIFTHALTTVESISALIPLFFSFTDIAYVHCVDAALTLLTGWMIIDILRSETINFYSASISILCLMFVDVTFIYGVIQDSFDIDDSVYAFSLLMCIYCRIVVSFLLSCIITHFVLADNNLAMWSDDHEGYEYRAYISESSNAFRVSLMAYDNAPENNIFHMQDKTYENVVVNDSKQEEFQNYYSLLFVNWITPLFLLAKKRPLCVGDIPPLPFSRSSAPNSHKFAFLQHEEKLSLYKVLQKLYLSEYMEAGGLLLLKSLLVFVGPIMLERLVLAAENNSSWNLIGCYIAILFVSKLLGAVVTAHYNLACQNLSVAVSAGMKGAMYQKILRLSSGSRQKYTIGNLTNLYTVDTDRVVRVTIALHNFWALPMQIVIAMVLLWWVVSYAMFAGLGMIGVVLIINNIIAKTTKTATDRVMENKDYRMKNISEAFSAMLTIKLNAWEANFESKILRSRTEELRHVWTVLWVVALNVFLLWIAPSMVSVSTIAVYTKVMGRRVTAANIFTALSLFKLLQSPLRELPQFITLFFQARTSMERLQKFLDLEEKGGDGFWINATNQQSPTEPGSNSGEPNLSEQRPYDPWDKTPKGGVRVSNAAFYWNTLASDEEGETHEEVVVHVDHDSSHSECDTDGVCFELKIDSLRVEPGSLVIVRGVVGSGKSSLCHALMGEMPLSEGSVHLSGSVAYCSQQAWIQSATLKENILFGHPFDPKKYKRVVDACCLTQDFKELPDGDNTYIGQKGLNLSGGQKARSALARAVYADKDIYILDDIFAALDAIVARKVFERVVLGLLARKTRIIVTHKIDIINHTAVDAVCDLMGGVLTVLASEASWSGVVNASDGSDHNIICPAEKMTSIEFVPYELRDVERDDTIDSFKLEATDDITPNNDTGCIRSEETKENGVVGMRVYMGYINAAGGIWVLVALISIQIMWQLMSIASDYFITQWSRQDEEQQERLMDENIGTYAAFALGSGLLVLARTLTVSTYGYRAAKKLFEDMLRSLMYAPMHWIDRNPTGRLLNRFGDDQDQIDYQVPICGGSVLSTVFNVSGSIITVMVITRFFGLLIIPAMYVYFTLMQLYITAAREIQRMQSVSKSPMLVILSESIDGLVQLRAFGPKTVQQAIQKNESVLDIYLGVTYTMAAAYSWFSLRLQLIGAVMILVVSVALFIGSGFISGGLVALSLAYMLSISDDMMSLVTILSVFEQAMVCPERVLQYVDVDREGTNKQKQLFALDHDATNSLTIEGTVADTDTLLPIPAPSHVSSPSEQDLGVALPKAEWPAAGVIEYRDVFFRYQPGQTEFVLRGINFKTCAGEKIGVVGRTGAGKSSLTMSLFRIAELSSGNVFIDGVDLSTLSLTCLRSAIEIVPQSPVLFKGSIRNYLDPFDEYSDHQIWCAIQKAGMADMLNAMARAQYFSGGRGSGMSISSSRGGRDSRQISPSEALQTELAENGENMSVGQRQMLVLSRALLRECRVLVMDEATAAMDSDTDRLLQKILHDEFKKATVITIAHRIDSIISCDRVIVMAAGRIIEFDTPASLMRNTASTFRELAIEAGVNIDQTP